MCIIYVSRIAAVILSEFLLGDSTINSSWDSSNNFNWKPFRTPPEIIIVIPLEIFVSILPRVPTGVPPKISPGISISVLSDISLRIFHAFFLCYLYLLLTLYFTNSCWNSSKTIQWNSCRNFNENFPRNVLLGRFAPLIYPGITQVFLLRFFQKLYWWFTHELLRESL